MDGSYRAYMNSYFGNPLSFFRGPWKQQPQQHEIHNRHQEALHPLTTHVSGSYQYLNCANGRLTPVNVTYDSDLHILDACPPPPKVFRLNPDAKTFVPMNVLNPYAREFKPKCFQEENLRHKRACGSTHSSEEDEVSSSDDCILSPPEQEGESSTLGDDDPMILSSIGGGNLSPPKNECSSERKDICDRLKICTLGDDESDSEDLNCSRSSSSSSDSEEDDDWDDLEFGSPQSPSAWGDIPDEFKDNFGLMCPLSQKPDTSRVKEFLLSVDSDNEDSSEDGFSEEEDSLREKELQDRLAAINKEWSLHYLKTPSSLPSSTLCPSDSGMKKNVSFSNENSWKVIEEDPELSKELRESRTSDHLARKADRERIENIISPILDPEHRNKVYSRLYKSEPL